MSGLSAIFAPRIRKTAAFIGALSGVERPPGALPGAPTLIRGYCELCARIVAGVAAGVALASAYAPWGYWPAVIPALALQLCLLRGVGFAAAAAIGFVTGMGFWLTLINWLTAYLGPEPWLALSINMSLWWAVSSVLISWLYRFLPRFLTGTAARWVTVPFSVAAAWLCREVLGASMPYGGFSWGRLATSQVDAPWAGALGWLGPTGLGIVMVGIAALVVELISSSYRQTQRLRFAVGGRTDAVALIGAVSAATLLGLSALPLAPTSSAGTLRILAVQGAVDASIFTTWKPGSVLSGQIAATLPFRGEPIDAVLWPENGSDLNPLTQSAAAQSLSALSRSFNAPILTGTVTSRADKVYNTVVQWNQAGLIDQYDKTRPVPFAEYVPDRAFWRNLAPDLVDVLARDFSPGTREPVLTVAGERIGVAICFEITIDAHIARMINNGARVIYAPSNNADFGRTAESRQQLDVNRMRALETGRDIVLVSTTGPSAMISPDGSIHGELEAWKPGGLVRSVALRDGLTPGVVVDGALGVAIVLWPIAIGLAMFAAALWNKTHAFLTGPAVAERRRQRRDFRHPAGPATG